MFQLGGGRHDEEELIETTSKIPMYVRYKPIYVERGGENEEEKEK